MKKGVLLDRQFVRLLEQIASIYDFSSRAAQREVGKRYEVLVNFYEKHGFKTIDQFFEAFDNSNLPEDYMLFSLVYFNHLFLNTKTQKYFGYEDYNVICANDYDRIMNPDDPADKLQHTGWRGSGKSTLQQINTIRAMYYTKRETIGVMARTLPKSRGLIKNMLTQFVAKESVDGEFVHTNFAKRANQMVIFSKSLKQKDRGNIESAFKSMSLTEGFSLLNGVTIIPYSPEAGARGANLYGARLNMVHMDDAEDYGEAGTAMGENIWNQATTFMNADTGNPDDKVIFTITGNRVNPEEESIFNRFIAASARDSSYIVRSIPKVDLIARESLTIRYSYDDIMRQIKASDRPAEITDCPLHTPEMLFPILDMQYKNLSELQASPSWRGLFIDPAFSRTNFSDSTGMIFAYANKEGKIFFGSKEVKANGSEIVQAIVREITEHKINYTFIESGTSESLLRSSVQQELYRMGINTVIFAEEAPRGIKKEDRIKDAYPLWDGTTMGFIEGMEEPLISQLISFDPYLLKTKTKRRGFDALDAFSYALTYIVGSNIIDEYDVPQDRPAFEEDEIFDDGTSLLPSY